MDASSDSYLQGYFSPHAEGISFDHTMSNGGDACLGNGDVSRLARNIFTDEVGDVIVVLQNCGALQTKDEYFWCVKELWRLLTEAGPGNVV